MVRRRVAPYVMTTGGSVAYFLLFALTIVVALPYVSPEARALVEPQLASFYGHASNLILSYFLVLLYVIRLPSGGSLRALAVWALILVAANLVYELFLPLWNVRDPVDALYGVVGSVVGFVVVALLRRYGTKPNPKVAGSTPPTGRN